MTHNLPTAISRTIEVLPSLAGLENAALEKLGDEAQLLEVPAGSVIFRPGDVCQTYFIVLAGTVRTSISSPNGREIVLYRVEAGETCILTTSCLLASTKYDTEGIAETDVVALAIPHQPFLKLLGISEKFRQLVFSAFSNRLNDLIVLINEISFGHLDTRLANYLISNANDNLVEATHQAISSELGSAREAVSRLLKEFERSSLIKLERGRIIITSPEKLKQYCK